MTWLWAGFVLVASLVLIVVFGVNTQGFASVVSAAAWLLLPVVYTGLGAVIASKDPGNRIAWILFLVGFAVLLDGAAQPFIQEQPVSPEFLDYLALFVANSMWLVIFFPLFLLLYLFPTGRFLTRRWSWAGWLAAAMVTVFIVLGTFIESWGPPNDDWMLDNPIGFIPSSFWDGLFGLTWSLGLIILPLGGFSAMAMRFRRSDVVKRTQIKWVLYSALVLALVYVASVLAVELGGSFGDLLIGNLFVFALFLLPLSITIAITRYRLFAIDRIISRTLAYTLVIALLGAVYFGMVTLVTSLLPAQNSLAVAGATLAIAALFNPVRRRIQHAVDRRFNRSGYQAEVISERFAAQLRESMTVEQVAQLWERTANETFNPSTASIWLNFKDTENRV